MWHEECYTQQKNEIKNLTENEELAVSQRTKNRSRSSRWTGVPISGTRGQALIQKLIGNRRIEWIGHSSPSLGYWRQGPPATKLGVSAMPQPIGYCCARRLCFLRCCCSSALEIRISSTSVCFQICLQNPPNPPYPYPFNRDPPRSSCDLSLRAGRS